MRASVLALLIALCAGCSAGIERTATEDSDDRLPDNGGSLQAECSAATDCVPAGPKCCDCPTHAVPVTDPAYAACVDVDCGPATCGSPMQAACELGECVLECAPVACGKDVACPGGYATDANGCLICECAAPDASTQCMMDSDCARVHDDCCGCENGGNDTAVPAGEVAAHASALMCPTDPSCPGQNTCAADLAARCIQGSCALVAGPLPPNACGRAGLPVCPAGEACYVNANDQATMHGVGVCQP